MRIDPSLSRSKAQRELTALFSGNEGAALDARLILCAALGIDHASLLRDPDRPVGAAAEKIMELAARRARHEPVSRILGRREFWGLDLAVGPAVLDPRPETETLVEAALKKLGAWRDRSLSVLDLGTGSGAILAAFMKELPKALGIGVDVSEPACRIARRNLADLGLESRASIICGHWTNPLRGRFDLIVSNPPYVATGAIEALAPDVRDHDPRLALDGGEDGMAAYREIIARLPELIRPGGFVALELGAGQARHVAGLLANAGFTRIETARDLAGHERVILAFPGP
ncbi:MAG TPA: peptide chain release factor N(5)-glutamine methyltransferase [Methylovirgula sp.]|nr:peptide chain release factor N(5)-glutamine methyltransferase [Methylovirgula sp.]